jgi:hypothetical protein
MIYQKKPDRYRVLIQVIGRGRGVNRTAQNPLDVHIPADVALPLIHDRIVPWDSIQPGIFERMLLASLAVDSPVDALACQRQSKSEPKGRAKCCHFWVGMIAA